MILAAYVQLTKNDLCLVEVCERLLEQGVQDFFFAVSAHSWDGKPVPTENLDSCHQAQKVLNAKGAKVRLKIIDTEWYRRPESTFVDVETRVRNAALTWIREAGFEHILVMDSDELWRRGFLSIVRDEILRRQPSAISCLMTPVLGLPGYPVLESLDQATIYMSPENSFNSCRRPTLPPTVLTIRGVLHFTGVRCTSEEIIAKFRNSGHYDDPEYQMEFWIREVLPNLAPGLRNCHPYRTGEVWPLIGAWDETDWREIPDSLKGYLGEKP